MIPQDISFNINLIDDNNVLRPGLLKMQYNNGNVSFIFYRESSETKKLSQIPESTFQLSDFITFELDPKEKLATSLSGCRARLQLRFLSDNDLKIFQQYLSTKVRLRISACNPCVFFFEPLDPEICFIPPFSSTILPFTNQIQTHRITKKDLEIHGLLLESSSECETYSLSDFNSSLDETGKLTNISEFSMSLFNKDFDKTLLRDIWPLILLPDFTKMNKTERNEFIQKHKEKYRNVKLQWKLTTFKQWKNSPVLRSLVDLIEKDLKEHSNLFDSFEHPRNVQELCFNILLTLSLWDPDGATYTKGMVNYISPFLTSYIFDVNDDQQVILHDKSTSAYDDVEADIFWCFYYFYIQNDISKLINPNSQPQMKELFTNVGAILEKFFPEIIQLLLQKHAQNLDFLLDDCTHWYSTSNSFTRDEIIRLWISVISYSMTSEHADLKPYFIISILFALAPSLIEFTPMNNEEFLSIFNTLKKEKLNLNLLLVNTMKIMDITKQEQKLSTPPPSPSP